MKPTPAVGQRWRFGREEDVIVRLCPGGGGNLGIAVFEGPIPPAHVSTMLAFPAWSYLGKVEASAPAFNPFAALEAAVREYTASANALGCGT